MLSKACTCAVTVFPELYKGSHVVYHVVTAALAIMGSMLSRLISLQCMSAEHTAFHKACKKKGGGYVQEAIGYT